ncbi:hypothetical protein TSAR_008099 [Trichomalopsis sarcophagae]|uniref:Uncharacterized protein n=1 Tax=Trichomalopsis sarcophagae TaxID=543379 RepID=A0A232FPA1_9HYME|nr:hypothetical protein TSAR_008099 [Trichomalopsis sarcophagae]
MLKEDSFRMIWRKLIFVLATVHTVVLLMNLMLIAVMNHELTKIKIIFLIIIRIYQQTTLHLRKITYQMQKISQLQVLLIKLRETYIT